MFRYQSTFDFRVVGLVIVVAVVVVLVVTEAAVNLVLVRAT